MIKINKNKKQRDLLEMPEVERIKFIKEIREKLQNKIVEAKLWNLLFEAEDLTINGNTIYKGNEPLSGFFINK
ncbi:MAG: hypothetical protein QW270_00700 [Candidatus Bathyarchaeia archaeon]